MTMNEKVDAGFAGVRFLGLAISLGSLRVPLIFLGARKGNVPGTFEQVAQKRNLPVHLCRPALLLYLVPIGVAAFVAFSLSPPSLALPLRPETCYRPASSPTFDAAELAEVVHR